MAYDRKKVIEIALNEVGYLEKASREQLDDKTANAGKANCTKYARDLDALGYYNGRKQGHAWCAVFANWAFVRAYGKAAALDLTCQPKKAANNCGAGCKYSRNYYKQKGRLFDTPQPGDQVFFYSSDKSSIAHTGLVYKVDDAKVYTVEGNTSGASGVIANGGGVFKKSYALNYKRLAGFGRPDYGTPAQEGVNAPENAPTTQAGKYITHTVQRGDRLWNLAKKHLGAGKRYKEIMELNGLKTDTIKIGQVLKIPQK